MSNNDNRALGPIDFLLLEFPDRDPSGETASELLALVDAGIIALYDIVAVRRDTDGNTTTFDLSELPEGAGGGFARFAGARSGLLSDDDVNEAAGVLEAGTIGVLLVYENAWAQPFVAAAQRAGGQVVANSRLSAQDIMNTLDTLDAAD